MLLIRRFIRKNLNVFCVGAIFGLCACTHQATIPDSAIFASELLNDFPSIAAEYESLTKNANGRSWHAWRIWRQPQYVIRDNLDEQITDSWQRIGDNFTLKKYFHAEQRGVEFFDDDLRMLNLIPHWPSTQGMVDVSVLERLKLIKSTERHAIPMQYYQGEIDGVRWRIEIRTDLMLPTVIEYKSNRQQQTIRLVSVYPLQQAPWQPGHLAGYPLIDFADFGDMENDPFVRRVEALLRVGHQHKH